MDQKSPLIPELLLAVGLLVPMLAAAGTEAPPAGAWQFLEGQLYGERDIGLAGAAFMRLEAPASTLDAAATPVTLRFGADAVGHIKRVRVMIDNNPSPVVGTFEFAADARIVELGLRVRIDRYTTVRAIAETDDGKLQMQSTWVNASGGCSAPPSAAAGGRLGEMRFRPSPDARSLLLSIRHPNHSGFQIDPVSGEPVPPHFVRHIRFSTDGRVLLEADLGISLSENPTLLIASDAPLRAPIMVDIDDSKDARFSANWGGGDAP